MKTLLIIAIVLFGILSVGVFLLIDGLHYLETNFPEK